VNISPLQLYRARCIIPMSSPIIEDGAIAVRDGVIIAVGRSTDLRKEYSSAVYHDLGEVILLPGLINAHCHLDYTMMRGQLTPGSSFSSWIEQIKILTESLQESDFLAAIDKGLQELGMWGCTTVFNIESFPNLLPSLPTTLLRLWQFIEVMDIRGSHQGEHGLAIIHDLLKNGCKNLGISPHAPPTTSQELYRRSRNLAEQYHLPFCTHLAESEEEFEMFTQGSGGLFHFLKGLGRNMNDCGSRSPVQLLLEEELLPKGSLLVHMNILSAKDRELLASRAADFFVIHCPKTHQFFERAPFDWRFFSTHAYRLLLGTDSLASNDGLNLFAEMRVMSATAPDLTPEDILKMVTLHPAAAVEMSGRLGELSPGAMADIITIPFGGTPQDAYSAVIHNTTQVF